MGERFEVAVAVSALLYLWGGRPFTVGSIDDGHVLPLPQALTLLRGAVRSRPDQVARCRREWPELFAALDALLRSAKATTFHDRPPPASFAARHERT